MAHSVIYHDSSVDVEKFYRLLKVYVVTLCHCSTDNVIDSDTLCQYLSLSASVCHSSICQCVSQFYMPVCLYLPECVTDLSASVCHSYICQSVSQIYLSVCVSICQCVSQFYLPVCVTVLSASVCHRSICQCVSQIYLSVCVSICQCVSQFYLPVCVTGLEYAIQQISNKSDNFK